MSVLRCRCRLFTVFYACALLLGGISVSVHSFAHYKELSNHTPNHCSHRLHCHQPAAAVFDILALHEGIVEPSIYVTITMGAPVTIYSSFPTAEAGNLHAGKQEQQRRGLSRRSSVLPHHEYRMNLILRRRADAYGKFFDDVASSPSLKYNFSFVTVLRDDCTLKTVTSEALFRAGHYFGTFSHRGPFSADRVLSVPDHRFIDTNGFRVLMSKLNSLSTPFLDRFPSVFWRGTSSGSKAGCLDILRVQIALRMKNELAANFKISKPKICELNNTYMDFDKAGIFGEYAAEEEWIKHRAIIDVDGNFATNGLPWRVLSGSVLFRVSSINSGWIEDLLEPHVHFIPLKSDLSDLLEATRLAATTDPAELAMLAKIAHNAKSLSDRLSYSSVVQHFSLAVNRLTELRANAMRLW